MTKNHLLVKELEKLVSYPSTSGNEVSIHAHLKEMLGGYADKLWKDTKDNLIALKGKSPEVCLFAHVDKVGFMVQKIQGKSMVKVVQLKSSQKTVFPYGPIAPVVITHRGESTSFAEGLLINLSEEEKDLGVKVDDASKIAPGDIVSYKPNFSTQGNLVISQGLDNKAGLLVCLEAFKQAKSCVLVASAQEEMPSKLASVAASVLNPKMALVVDVTYTEDSIKTGLGPTICLKDSVIPDLGVVKKLEKAAKEAKTPFQYEVLEEGGSEAGAVEKAGIGIPLCFVGIPLEHMHSPTEILYISDLNSSISLISTFLKDGSEHV